MCDRIGYIDGMDIKQRNSRFLGAMGELQLAAYRKQWLADKTEEFRKRGEAVHEYVQGLIDSGKIAKLKTDNSFRSCHRWPRRSRSPYGGYKYEWPDEMDE